MVIDPAKVAGRPFNENVERGFRSQPPVSAEARAPKDHDEGARKPEADTPQKKREEPLNPEYNELKAAYIKFMTAYIKRDIERDRTVSRRGFLGGGKKPAQTLKELCDRDTDWVSSAVKFRLSRIMRNYINMDNMNALMRIQSKTRHDFDVPMRVVLKNMKSSDSYVLSAKAAKDIAMGYLDMAVAHNLLTLSFERQGLIEDRRVLEAYRDTAGVIERKLNEYKGLDGELTDALEPMGKIVARMFDPRAVQQNLLDLWDEDLAQIFHEISGIAPKPAVSAADQKAQKDQKDQAEQKKLPPKRPNGTDDPGPF